MDGAIRFKPQVFERVWGGRRLEQFGKDLPEGAVIGESWELVDRPEADSVVASPPAVAGMTLGRLWRERREEVFGQRAAAWGERYPLLVKLLDCEQTLSVQVHPPAALADELGGEPKTEMWVIADARPGAHLFAGLRAGVTRDQFEAGLEAGDDVSALLHRIDVSPGDVMYLPSGRVHAIGAGCFIVEVQQNSDTTYRVFDFNRPGLDGKPRELHVEQSMRSIDWDDEEPALAAPDGEVLVRSPWFVTERWDVDAARDAVEPGECALFCGLGGIPEVCGAELHPGEFALVPATLARAQVSGQGSLLRVTLPEAPPAG